MNKKLIVATIVVLLVLSAFAFWFFTMRSESLEVSNRNISTENIEDIESRDTADGNWIVSRQDDVFAGYEIQELFGGDTVKITAIGRSNGVSGGFTIENNVISDAKITVDMTSLKSDSSSRDNMMRNSGLETNTYQKAEFVQSQPVTIKENIVRDKDIIVTIPGKLTLHGVTNEITVDLTALFDGRVITLSGEIDIALNDYDIVPPDSSFVSVDGTGKIKLQLLFVPQK